MARPSETTGHALTFLLDESGANPRWTAVCDIDAVTSDVLGEQLVSADVDDDDIPAITGYVFQLRPVVWNGSAWVLAPNKHIIEKTIMAQGDDDDPLTDPSDPTKCHFTKLPRNRDLSFQFRARALGPEGELGRFGPLVDDVETWGPVDSSGVTAPKNPWVESASYQDATPKNPIVTTSEQLVGFVGVVWQAPADPNDSSIGDRDIVGYLVEVATDGSSEAQFDATKVSYEVGTTRLRHNAVSGQAYWIGVRSVSATGEKSQRVYHNGSTTLPATGIQSISPTSQRVEADEVVARSYVEIHEPPTESTAPVQSATGTASDATSVSATWGGATVSGRLLVAALSYRQVLSETPVPPAGWSVIGGSTVTVGGSTVITRLYQIANSAARSGTETFTFFYTQLAAALTIIEYSGARIIAPLDKTASSTGTSTTAASGTTAAVTQNEEELVAVIANFDDVAQTSPTNGFAARGAELTAGSTSKIHHRVYDKADTDGGTASTAVTLASSKAWVGYIATFKANVASDPGTPPANAVRIYPNDIAGMQLLVHKDDASVEHILRTRHIGCKAYLNANEATVTATPEILGFAAESYDHGAYHDNVTNNGRLTIPTGLAGKHEIIANVQWATNATGRRVITLFKNGVALMVVQANAVSGQVTTAELDYKGVCAAGDYFQVEVNQNSGGNLDVNSGEDLTNFSVEYIGD